MTLFIATFYFLSNLQLPQFPVTIHSYIYTVYRVFKDSVNVEDYIPVIWRKEKKNHLLF